MLQTLDKYWNIDDTPQYWEGIIDDPEYYCKWKDVEYCINNPAFFDMKFIDRISNTFIPIQTYDRHWSIPHAEQSELMRMFEDGHTLIINSFDLIDQQRQNIMKSVEYTFPGIRASMHIYAGLRDSKSFRIHEDLANNFILQIDGETHWRVYENRASNLVSQMVDSPTHDSLNCVIDVIMKPGDMLYIPARCYHQAQPMNKRLSVSIPMQHLMPHLKPKDRHYYEIPQSVSLYSKV
jgi:hypothetical protein